MNRTRRHFLRQIGIYLAATSCTGWSSVVGAREFEGCSLSAAAAASASRMGRISQSSGNQVIDYLFSIEAELQSQVAGVWPDLGFIDDGEHPNALATPESLFGSLDGTVLMGVNLIRYEMRMGSMDPAPILIMMHEWTHIKEFHTGAVGYVKMMELLSDSMAGWYLQMKAMSMPTLPTAGMRAMQSLFEKGDYAFNDPNHHGTPDERVSALIIGSNFAKQGVFDYDTVFNQLRIQYRL